MATRLDEVRAKFNHAGNKGASVEQVFRSFLREYLPRRLEIGHGEIIDTHDSRSNQTDVVIVNENHPFTFTPDNPAIFFVEGVSAAGEVKTVLNSTHLDSAIASCRRFKSLRVTLGNGTTIFTNPADEARFYTCPPYFLFAFESELTFPTILDRLQATFPNPEEKPYPLLDAVFLLDKGWAINFGDGQGALKFRTAATESLPGWVWQQSGNILLTFFYWLSSVMPCMLRYAPVLLEYMTRHKIAKPLSKEPSQA